MTTHVWPSHDVHVHLPIVIPLSLVLIMWQKVQKCKGGRLVWIRRGRFGEVKWGYIDSFGECRIIWVRELYDISN